MKALTTILAGLGLLVLGCRSDHGGRAPSISPTTMVATPLSTPAMNPGPQSPVPNAGLGATGTGGDGGVP